MKYNQKITFFLLGMFVVTQLIGIAVINADPFKVDANINGSIQEVSNPYLSWIDQPEPQSQSEAFGALSGLIIAFIIAICLMFLFMKFRIEVILKGWFFVVVSIALFLTFLAFEKIVPFTISLETALIFAAVLALPLAFIKVYKRNFLVHNLTELFVYPGIALIFVSILNIATAVILLVIISAYDMWAVWHSGVMQKMAKYQINKLQIFAGFFLPYASKQVKEKIKRMKKSELKKTKIKINLAILGGGDVIFPIIAAGVVFLSRGLAPALMVTLGATIGLAYLFFLAKKKRYYPAMPFITIGILIAMIISYIIF